MRPGRSDRRTAPDRDGRRLMGTQSDAGDFVKGFLGAIDRGVRVAEVACAVFAGAVLLCAMLLVAADALLRYVFEKPLTFQFNLTEKYLLVALICLALPWGFRTGGYIRIMGVSGILPVAASRFLIRVGLLASAAYCAALAFLAGRETLDAYLKGKAVLGVIDWPVYLSWIWIPMGLGLLSLRLLLNTFGPDADLDPDRSHAEEL